MQTLSKIIHLKRHQEIVSIWWHSNVYILALFDDWNLQPALPKYSAIKRLLGWPPFSASYFNFTWLEYVKKIVLDCCKTAHQQVFLNWKMLYCGLCLSCHKKCQKKTLALYKSEKDWKFNGNWSMHLPEASFVSL